MYVRLCESCESNMILLSTDDMDVNKLRKYVIIHAVHFTRLQIHISTDHLMDSRCVCNHSMYIVLLSDAQGYNCYLPRPLRNKTRNSVFIFLYEIINPMSVSIPNKESFHKMWQSILKMSNRSEIWHFDSTVQFQNYRILSVKKLVAQIFCQTLEKNVRQWNWTWLWLIDSKVFTQSLWYIQYIRYMICIW